MFHIHCKSLDWGPLELRLETGKIARHTAGAIVARYGDTTVLCTVAISAAAIPHAGFLPLSVHYQEKAFAAGKIPGGFLKREGKPAEREVLISRLIDRSLRPLFPKDFHHEVQVICTVMSYDPEADPVIVAMNGAAAAVALSGLPTDSQVAAVRIGRTEEGQWVVNPASHQEDSLTLDLVIAGTRDGILMVESEANELDEEIILEAIQQGHQEIQPVIQMIESFRAEIGRVHWESSFHEPRSIDLSLSEGASSLEARLAVLGAQEFEALCRETDRKLRRERLHALKMQLFAELEAEEGINSVALPNSFQNVWREVVRTHILTTGHRLDGRLTDEVRSIECEVSYLPRTHGSALFTRGETQAIVTVTLGGKEDSQLIESLSGTYRDPFLLHYNFPPYSVGEVGKVGAPGRREIGHGHLARRALQAVLPQKFPYTIRIVSEITDSNGSTSMATVCGATLALMDAGVPLRAPVAGIAMGLIMEGQSYKILSDISGTEDHLGDMDFKVTSTEKGITALQMDIKIPMLTMDLLKAALQQARKGCLHILKVMTQQTLQQPRPHFSGYAPSVKTLSIPSNKIGSLIGPGGKNIKEITESTGAKIEIAEDGTVTIFGATGKISQDAEARVRMATGVPVVGEMYDAQIVTIIDPAIAFAKFGFSDDGVLHISEVTGDKSIKRISDILAVGDKVRVKCIGIEASARHNRPKLSIRQALHPSKT